MNNKKYLHQLGIWEGSEWQLIKNEYDEYCLREIKLNSVGSYLEPSEFVDYAISHIAWLLSGHKA